MKIQTIKGITITTDSIPAGNRQDRQSREREAVNAMIRELYGDTAVIKHRPDGAPYIENRPDVMISISHSATRAAIALLTGTTPIGIDTETLRPQLERILDRYLSPAEQTEWTTPVDHLIAWCIKEAAYKAAGIPGIDLAHDITISRTEGRVTVRDIILDYTIAEQTDTDAIVLATRPVSTNDI
ncbi:MAG: 4'-phosphopantetheinyl transferase superfamily protein [Muribaculaceae bacterium]|nr:4'-phosphopantetheinyl transferase superfamily protein [Muribaculaceae bacterium]